MFIREQAPELNSEEMVKWLETKFENEKMIAIGKVDDYFIFLNFEMYCQAAMMVMAKMNNKGVV